MSVEPQSTIARIETHVRLLVAFDGALTPDMRLREDLDMDSLDAVDLAIRVEVEFDVELTDEDIEHLATAGELVALVDRKLAERAR